MGYRSHVMYAIHGHKDTMVAFVAAAALQGHGAALAELKMMNYGAAESVVLAGDFENVKWYPDYPDVKTHEALWLYANAAYGEDKMDISGKFCRIGENDDDTEVKEFGDYGELYELVSISRVIETSIDFSTPDRRGETT